MSTVQQVSQQLKERVLVVGATGFAGRALCRALSAAGFHVIASARHYRGDLACDDFVELDLERQQFSTEHLLGISSVFYLAAIAHAGRHVDIAASRYQRVNCEAAIELAILAQRVGVAHFHYVSSVKAMGYESSAMVLDETAGITPVDAYGCSKKNAEDRLLALAAGSTMKITISRPVLMFGEQVRGNLARLANCARWRWAPALPQGGARSMLALSDFVAAMLRFAKGYGHHGEIYLLAGGASSAAELLAQLRAAAGLTPARWRVPLFLMRLIAGVGDLARRAGMAPPWDGEQQEKLFGPLLVDAGKARRDLDWQAATSFRDVAPALLKGVAA